MKTPSQPAPPGSIPFKQFLTDRARERGLKWQTLYMRVKRGQESLPGTMFRGGRKRIFAVIP